jgi:hypothetical protein
MADDPKTPDDTTTTSTGKGPIMHPDGMNPHIVPEQQSGEEQPADEE